MGRVHLMVTAEGLQSAAGGLDPDDLQRPLQPKPLYQLQEQLPSPFWAADQQECRAIQPRLAPEDK